jgi:hypothetical protein
MSEGTKTLSQAQKDMIDETFELRIVDFKYLKDDRGYQGAEDPKDRAQLILEVLGTENPDQDDKPFSVWMFNLNDGRLAYTDRDSNPAESNMGKVLLKAGFTRDELTKSSFKKLNFEALKGVYLRGKITANKGGTAIRVNARDLATVKNQDHIKFNKARQEDVFTPATATV